MNRREWLAKSTLTGVAMLGSATMRGAQSERSPVSQTNSVTVSRSIGDATAAEAVSIVELHSEVVTVTGGAVASILSKHTPKRINLAIDRGLFEKVGQSFVERKWEFVPSWGGDSRGISFLKNGTIVEVIDIEKLSDRKYSDLNEEALFAHSDLRLLISGEKMTCEKYSDYNQLTLRQTKFRGVQKHMSVVMCGLLAQALYGLESSTAFRNLSEELLNAGALSAADKDVLSVYFDHFVLFRQYGAEAKWKEVGASAIVSVAYRRRFEGDIKTLFAQLDRHQSSGSSTALAQILMAKVDRGVPRILDIYRQANLSPRGSLVLVKAMEIARCA
jgi:hypothetical protein